MKLWKLLFSLGALGALLASSANAVACSCVVNSLYDDHDCGCTRLETFAPRNAPSPPRATPPRPPQITPPPQIWLDPAQGKLQPIQLRDVSIDVHINGFIANTTMDMTFYNPNARVLEGELLFPIADGQSVTGYALEVNGALRQGVVVEKQTARVAFEDTTRRGIDPGLAELTRGNVFRTRLYPIPAQGGKRVVVSFDQPLLDAGKDWRYVLPLAFTQPIRHFRVHAEAARAQAQPIASSGADGNAGAALSFTHWQDSYVASLERTDFQPDRELSFTLEKPAQPVTTFAVQDAREPAWRFFAAQVQTAAPDARAAVPPPRRIALYYDASGNAQHRDRQRELAALTAWLAQLGDVQVDLTVFRNDADPTQTFRLRGGDSRALNALRQAIETQPLDGGSSYGAIQLDANAQPDLVLIVGDGLSNFGPRAPHLRFADGRAPRVVVMHAAQMADGALLARLVRGTGGQVINLLQTSPEEALRELNTAPWMLRQARVTSGECRDLAPAAPVPVGATVSLYGRCHGAATLDLQFDAGAGGPTVHRTVRIPESASKNAGNGTGNTALLDPARGAFILRLWAAARIADLQTTAPDEANEAAGADDANNANDATGADNATNEAAIIALAKRYGVVTANTSLLVLDRIEDYVRYQVEPREPELRAQYRRMLADQPRLPDAASAQKAHLATITRQWDAFRAWHDKRHAWLETVLKPTAAAELTRWQTLPSLRGDKTAIARAGALLNHAQALQQRWPHDSANPTRRGAWEKEAAQAMLQLDALRLQRLQLAPDSDNPAQAREDDAAPQGSANQAQMAEAAPAAMAPPAPSTFAHAAPAGASAERSVQARSKAPVSGGENAADVSATANAYASAGHASIQLQEANADKPYMDSLRKAASTADPTRLYAAYLAERGQYAASPSFYLDVADYFRNVAKEPRLALRILSNLAGIDLDNAPLLRVLAYRLEQWNRFDLAVPLFGDALKLRGEEPQSYRDLGLALSRQSAPDYRRATRLLWHVANHEWDSRFPEIETIALHELNDVLMRAPPAERTALTDMLRKAGASRDLLTPVPVNLRVALTWDADNTDVDLWVIEPDGEVAIYSHNRTRIGGHLSHDFTQGYGPEVYTIRRPIPGTYIVKAHYYGNHQQKLTGDVTVQAEFLTQFDTGQSQREAITRRLEDQKDLIEIGRFKVGAD